MPKLMTGGKKKNINDVLLDGEGRKKSEAKVKVTLMLPKDMVRKVKIMRIERDRSMGDLVAEALRNTFPEADL